jgi:DNA repair photolyase
MKKEWDMIIHEESSGEIFTLNEAGERHLKIYRGCEDACPFCYWQADPSWLNQLTVYTDVAEKLENAIDDISEHSVIRLGYGALEPQWGLARKCMEILLDHHMSLIVSAGDSIVNDLDLLTRSDADVKVIMEFTKFPLIKEFNETGTNKLFLAANIVKSRGLDICITVSPVLPGITDVEKIAAALPGIPVHISLLDVRPGTMWNEKTLAYINEHYPELYPVYQQIAETGKDPYYESLYEKYKDGHGQIRTDLPFFDFRPADNESATH